MSPEFIPGLQLNEWFYHEAVRPILDRFFPGLPHSAALIGFGSDVIGFDTPTSRDHLWGPRLQIFLRPEEMDVAAPQVHEALRQNLPVSFRGYSTHFGTPDKIGVRLLTPVKRGPVDHLVTFHTIAGFWQQELGWDPGETPPPAAWLTFQEHRLLTLTTGKVYHDDLGLNEARARFAYYPHDVWLYLLAAQWALISQEEAFVGRTAGVGDGLGSRVITARLVERIMRLCFLLEKTYAPYSKWFGLAFKRLACYPQIGPVLENALAAGDYPEREGWLVPAYRMAAEMHNALQVGPPVEVVTRTFSGWHLHHAGKPVTPEADTRPYQVLFSERFVDAIRSAIEDPAVLALPANFGSVNQFMVESSDAVQSVAFCRRLEDDLA